MSAAHVAPSSPIVLTGTAYQRRATLEINGDTLSWRAQRGQLQPVAENVATTVHDLRNVTWLERRHSLGGGVLAALSVMWMFTESVAFGALTFAVATALLVWRRVRPRYWLALDLGDRWLVMRVDHTSAAAARALAVRIEQRLLTGEVSAIPPTLP